MPLPICVGTRRWAALRIGYEVYGQRVGAGVLCTVECEGLRAQESTMG